MKIAFERSPNQIYDRIVLELASGFRDWGHECILVEANAVKNIGDLLTAYNAADIVLITNSTGLLSLQREDGFIFELIRPKLVFLHHDAPFGSPDIAAIRGKLDAFIRVKARSLHFTIEETDLVDLCTLGIPCFPISHIVTLGAIKRPDQQTEWARDVAFLGHIVPPNDLVIDFGTPDDANYFESYRARVLNAEHGIKADFMRHHRLVEGTSLVDYLSRKAQYIQYVNFFTMFQRGALLQSIKGKTLDIYGGDPAWLHGVEQTRFLAGEHIRYHRPVFDPESVASIFMTTRVNLNITSLQFDSALINRVADCASVGGLMLTDRKKQLFELTSVADEISYSNHEELAEKIAFYTNPANRAATQEISRQLSVDLTINCSVNSTVQKILERVG